MSLKRWLQKIILGMGLSKLSSVIWPCVDGASAERTQSNLQMLNKLSAPGDCEASSGTLETCETRDIPFTSYRVSTAQLYPTGVWCTR